MRAGNFHRNVIIGRQLGWPTSDGCLATELVELATQLNQARDFSTPVGSRRVLVRCNRPVSASRRRMVVETA